MNITLDHIDCVAQQLPCTRHMKKIISIMSLSVLIMTSGACGGGSDSNTGSDTDAGAGGGGGGGGPGGVRPPNQGMDFVYPTTAYTGFDGTNTYKVPVGTNLTNVTWTIDDPTFADIAAVAAPTGTEFSRFGGTWAMVTTRKAGTTKITATGGGKTVTAALVVTTYTTANLAVGDTRYNTPADATAAQRASCASCHKLANGADHSPLVLEWYKDDEILSAVTTGVYPAAAGGYVLQGVNHAWNLTDAEKLGIVPYLRALPPRGF